MMSAVELLTRWEDCMYSSSFLFFCFYFDSWHICQESKNKNDEEKENEDKSAHTKAKNDARRVIDKAKEMERSRWVDEFETQDAKVEKDKDVGGGGCIKDENGKIEVEEERARNVWAAYYKKLLNEEFDWNINELIDADAVSGPLEEIYMQEVRAAIHKIKNDKSTELTGVAAEMLKSSGESGVRWLTDLLNALVK